MFLGKALESETFLRQECQPLANKYFASLPLILTASLHLVYYHSRYSGEPIGSGFSLPGAQNSEDLHFPSLSSVLQNWPLLSGLHHRGGWVRQLERSVSRL